MLWNVLRLVIAAIGVTILALLSGVGEDEKDGPRTLPPGTSIARCPAFDGQGNPEWRERSIVAGPVGVRKMPPPLGSMDSRNGNVLGATMPILIAGTQPVRITIPDAQRGIRIFYNGRANSIRSSRGFRSILFVPCTDQARTIFPGGIAVLASPDPLAAVRLRVKVRDSDSPAEVLNLGRPKASEPDREEPGATGETGPTGETQPAE